MSCGRVLVYGGKGALGAKCVSHFKGKNYWVGSIDLGENPEADLNILVEKNDEIIDQETKILSSVSAALNGTKLDAIVCVAGGWAGGDAKTDLIKNSDLMWRQSVWSSLISASVAAHHLKQGGFLSLTGAKAALEPTSGMMGYGMAKSAVHHLTKSLGDDKSGLPENSTVLALLPVTLDTPMNRKWMPKADFSTWTPLEEIADKLYQWTVGQNRPNSGTLIQVITKDNQTEFTPVQ